MSLKILIIQGGVNRNLPSGEEIVINNEYNYLSKNNTVNVEYIDSKGGIIKKISGLIWSFENYRKVKSLINKYKPNVIHFHTIVPYLSLSVIFAAKRKNIKIIQTLHNGRWICVEGGFIRKGKYCKKCVGNSGFSGVKYGCQNGIFASALLYINNLLFRYLQKKYNLIDRFIPVSEYIRKKHIQTGFHEKDLKINNNGIDLKKIEKIKNSINTKDFPSGIVFAGRVSKAKGSDVLKYLISEFKYKTFHIIGDGPDLNALKNYSSVNNYKKVIFWGKLDYEKTLKIISTSECTVVPSQLGEAFGLVAAESMALGVPVVSSKLGELENMVTRGGGTVVNPRDFEEFKKAIESYLKNRNKAKLSSKKGYEYVSKNLSIESGIERLNKIYKGL